MRDLFNEPDEAQLEFELGRLQLDIEMARELEARYLESAERLLQIASMGAQDGEEIRREAARQQAHAHEWAQFAESKRAEILRLNRTLLEIAHRHALRALRAFEQRLSRLRKAAVHSGQEIKEAEKRVAELRGRAREASRELEKFIAENGL